MSYKHILVLTDCFEDADTAVRTAIHDGGPTLTDLDLYHPAAV